MARRKTTRLGAIKPTDIVDLSDIQGILLDVFREGRRQDTERRRGSNVIAIDELIRRSLAKGRRGGQR